jgi:hypothetical protein
LIFQDFGVYFGPLFLLVCHITSFCFYFIKKKTATPNKISKNARNHEMRANFIKPHNLGKTGLKKIKT